MATSPDLKNHKQPDRGFNRRTFLWLLPSVTTGVFGWLFLKSFPSNFSKGLIKGKITLLRDQTAVKGLRESAIGNIPFRNIKSGVTHYPTAYIFNYYSRTEEQNMELLDADALATGVKAHKLNPQYSGIVLEYLALRSLAPAAADITPARLETATDLVTEAFDKKYGYMRRARTKDGKKTEAFVLHNRFNWRLYELLVQLLALNARLSDEQRVSRFRTITDLSGIGLNDLPPRDSWMLSDPDVKIRMQRIWFFRDQYMERLVCRHKAAIESRRILYECRNRIPVAQFK